jgi:competence protein ComEA
VVTSTTELIDINTASTTELEELPGIGPTTAQKIVEYREQNGPFISIEDIINVSGIGPGTYERIKDLITVGPS